MASYILEKFFPTEWKRSCKNLLLLLVLILGFASLTQKAYGQVYKGFVLDEITREPIPYIIVMLQSLEGEYVRHDNTDDNGSFEIEAPEVKEYMVHVSRIGYTENTGGPFLVEEGDTLNIQFRVLEQTETLDEVTVEAERIEKQFALKNLEENRFFIRQERGLGEFMTKEDIEKMVAVSKPSQLFRMVPGISANFNGDLYNTFSNCPPKLIVNGMAMSYPSDLTFQSKFSTPFNIDSYVNLESIIGVEVYTDLIGQPVEYGPRSRCGAVVVWAR